MYFDLKSALFSKEKLLKIDINFYLQSHNPDKIGLIQIHPMSCDKSDEKCDKHVNFEFLYNNNIS